MSVFFEHGYALLIGIDENAVSRFTLPAVSKDIAALYAVLTHPERCAYRAEQVKQITGKAAQGAQANDQRLARQIEQLTALLPDAAAILSLTFTQPALAPAIGPVTKYVLSKLT